MVVVVVVGWWGWWVVVVGLQKLTISENDVSMIMLIINLVLEMGCLSLERLQQL